MRNMPHMTLMETIHSPLIHNEDVFSPALRIGDFIFISAQNASGSEGYKPSMDILLQTQISLKNVLNLLRETMNQPSAVIRLNVTAVRESDIPVIRSVLAKAFVEPYPVIEITGAAFLEHGCAVQISALAADAFRIAQMQAQPLGCEGCERRG